MPEDLPLPSGTYLVTAATVTDASAQLLAVVPLEFRSLLDYLEREWPSHGWSQGRDEAEGDEAEWGFSNGSREVDLVAREVYCDKDMTELRLSIAQR